MEKLQNDCNEYILYSPDSLKYITDPMDNILKVKINEYKSFFKVDDCPKFQINYFDDKEKFKSFIYELRGETNSLPEYAEGTFDRDMINAYISPDLVINSKKYNEKLYMSSHEIFHIMYKNYVLKPLGMKRIVWFDEGMAMLFSGEFSHLNDKDEFNSFFISVKNNTKMIPDLNKLSHGRNFQNELYSGYDLSFLSVKYLYDFLGVEEFKKLMCNNEQILNYGSNIVDSMFNYYSSLHSR